MPDTLTRLCAESADLEAAGACAASKAASKDAAAESVDASGSASDDDDASDDDASTSSTSSYDTDSDSDAPLLAATILAEISAGTYTCLVCTSEIDARSKIWLCGACYRVYDLDCIRDWALRGSSTDKVKRHWRCPACNAETLAVPLRFTCWCGRVTNPDANALAPFSCGNPCGAPYADCVHRCALQCHPALHPVCGAVGPVMACKCGKHRRQLPCLITPYRDGWHCDEPCGTVVCQRGHRCRQGGTGGCHLGFCGACREGVRARCYCGKTDEVVECGGMVPKRCAPVSASAAPVAAPTVTDAGASGTSSISSSSSDDAAVASVSKSASAATGAGSAGSGLDNSAVAAPSSAGLELDSSAVAAPSNAGSGLDSSAAVSAASAASGGSGWIGMFACPSPTTLFHDCGIHLETLPCQPLPPTPPPCRLSPTRITTCPCGSHRVDALLVATGQPPRTACTDPVPTCASRCNKLLPCGCRCLAQCHPGECVCYNKLEVKCRCQLQTFMVPCKFVQQGFEPRCHHKCLVLMSCRKHYHRAECCAYEQTAQQRERAARKAVRNGARVLLAAHDDEIMTMEAVHICMQPCQRLKLCGRHRCEALCHLGPCGVCLELSNDDLVCHCGRTVVPAPVRCGTKLACPYQCLRAQPCGHPQLPHACHDDAAACPKCVKLVVRPCDCGRHPAVPNVVCSQTRVLCGNVCRVAKLCGHACGRVCSKECTRGEHAPSLACQSVCKRIRRLCPHACPAKCHATKRGVNPECDVAVCKEKVEVRCQCGRRREAAACGASARSGSRIDLVLACDEECAQARRDKELMRAFEAGDDAARQRLLEEEIEYPDSVMAVFAKQRTWCGRVEQQIRGFVRKQQLPAQLAAEAEPAQLAGDPPTDSSSATNPPSATESPAAPSGAESASATEASSATGSSSTGSPSIESPPLAPISARMLHFPPGNEAQRRFIHELAETYHLYSGSQGVEPHRLVFVVVSAVTAAPRLTIEQATARKNAIISEYNAARELKQTMIQESLCNAIFIQDAFFGATQAVLAHEVRALVAASGLSAFSDAEVHWMNASNYCVVSPLTASAMTPTLEAQLYQLMRELKQMIRDKSLAFNCKLCLVDAQVEHVLKTDEQIRLSPSPPPDSVETENDLTEKTEVPLSDHAADTAWLRV